jgi:hypothetical protein
MSAHSLKQELLGKIARLPENRLREVLDFASFLLLQEQLKPDNGRQHKLELDPESDPLLEYIGKVSHGSLAQDIDKELYGS